MGVKRPKY